MKLAYHLEWIVKLKKFSQQIEVQQIEKILNIFTASNSKSLLLKPPQNESYTKEHNIGKHIKHSSKMVKLNPVLKSNLIKVGFRMLHAKISIEIKYQKIITSPN